MEQERASTRSKPIRTPVEDVLEHCSKPGRELTIGRSLAPVLLVQVPDDPVAEEIALVEAMEHLLWDEMERLRGEHAAGIRKDGGVAAAVQRFQQDVALDHPKLTALSLLWAYYIERLSADKLGKVLARAERTMYEWLAKALPELEQLIARRAWQKKVHSDGMEPQHNDNVRGDLSSASKNTFTSKDSISGREDTTTSAEAGVSLGSSSCDGSAIPPDLSRGHEHRANISANTLFLLTGERARVVLDRDAAPETAMSLKDNRTEADRLQSAVVLLLMVLSGWLVFWAPVWSLAAIIVICVWRTLAYISRTIRAYQAHDTENMWWSLFSLVPWLVLLGMSLGLALHVPVVRQTPLYSTERLGLALRGLCICAVMLLLGLADTLFWIDRAAPPWGPWRSFKSHAAWAYEHRWEASALGWLALMMLSLALVLTRVF